MPVFSVIPYCGTPPAPGDILTRWNPDQVLLAVFAAVAVWLAVSARMTAAQPSGPHRMAFAGLAVTAFAFLSPLCALSVALFSARVGQHLLLTFAAAPLIAAALAHKLPRLRSGAGAPIAAAIVFAVAFWGWHLPAPYAATLASPVIYWLMQISLLLSAVWLWTSFFRSAADHNPAGVAAALFTAVQMTVFSGVLFFSGHIWHPWHETTTWVWGLTPLDDQVLGAVLMWVVGGAAFLAITAAALIPVINADRGPHEA